MSAERGNDLPEGVINADPAGGWEGGGAADGESAERSAAAAGSPELTHAGSSAHEGTRVEGPETTQNADPDLSTDDDLSEQEA